MKPQVRKSQGRAVNLRHQYAEPLATFLPTGYTHPALTYPWELYAASRMGQCFVHVGKVSQVKHYL